MKCTLVQKELADAVLNIQRAVSAKSTTPALEGILLDASSGKLTLSAYDMELGMTTELNASIEEEGRIVLSARLFGDIVRRLPTDTLEISVDEKNIAILHSGASEFTIIGIPAEEFPEFPSVSDGARMTISQPLLKSMIRQTLFAVADTDNKPVHTGSLFELSGGQLRVVSVDGYRLAMRTEPVISQEELRFVVPGKTLSELLKLLKDDEEEMEFFVGRRHIIFRIGNYTVISSLLEGEFLDYRAAIPASGATEVTVQTRAFISSVERVSLLITDRLKSPIRTIIEENEIKLFCSTPIGRANDQLPCEMTGDRVEIGFNNRYLLDALRNADGDEVKLSLNGALSPMKVLPREGDSFLFLVLPVRMKSEEF